MDIKIGFSSGYRYNHISPFSEKAISRCAEVSTDVVEINCVGGLVIAGRDVRDMENNWFSRFGQITLHSPSCDIIYGENKQSYLILEEIEKLCKKHKFCHVVFHPDLIDNYDVFLEFDIPIAIENMDKRKSIGVSVEGMKRIMDKGAWGFVLDLNHCYSIDPSMELARKFAEKFRERLVGIHLSGYVNYHELLYVTRQREILEAIPDIDIPIILEGMCTRENFDLKKEVEYVRGFFRKI